MGLAPVGRTSKELFGIPTVTFTELFQMSPKSFQMVGKGRGVPRCGGGAAGVQKLSSDVGDLGLSSVQQFHLTHIY